MFTLVPLIIGLGFVVITGTIFFMVVKGVRQWSADNNSPLESAEIRVVTKREHVSGSSQPNMPGRTSTWYYCTFEFQNGERREFALSGHEYGLLAEGDTGVLTFQGLRYKGFQRRA